MALLSKSFDAETTGAVPSGWMELAGSGYWTVETAPAGMSGKALRGAQRVGADSYFKSPSFTRQTSGVVYVGWWQKVGTVASGKDFAYVTLRDGGVPSVGTFRTGTFVSGTTMYGYYGAGGVSTVAIKSSLSSDTVYYVCVALDIDNKKVKFSVNGTWTDNSGSWYSVGASTPSFDNIVFDSYTGASRTGYDWIDNLLVSTTAPVASAPPAGTVYASGTHQSVACGSNIYGQPTLVYEHTTPDPTVARWTVERSSDNSTWVDITSGCTILALGSGHAKIVDLRPQYGSQAIAYGSTGYYRVTPWPDAFVLDGSSASASSAASLTIDVDKAAVRAASYAVLSAYMDSQTDDCITSQAGAYYPGESLVSMALAYYESVAAGSPNATYLSRVQSQYTYAILPLIDSNKVLHFPAFSTTDRDYHCRTAGHCAIASRLMKYAGQASLSNDLLTTADDLGKAFWDQFGAGSPTASWTRASYYPANQTAWQAGHAYTAGEIVRKTSNNGHTYRAMNAGTSGGSEPTWPTGSGATVTDNGITWKETSVTAPCSYPSYSVGSPYSHGVSPTVDPNKNATEALLMSLLATDPRSSFYAAGTYRTKALDHISNVSLLVAACQGSGGMLSLGDAWTPGEDAYDTLYAAYTLQQLSMVYHLMGAVVPELPLVLSTTLNWLETRSGGATEPQTRIKYGGIPPWGSADVGIGDILWRVVAARALGTTSVMDKLPYSGAWWDAATARYTPYTPAGGGSPYAALYQPIWEGEAAISAIIARIDASAADAWGWTDTAPLAVSRPTSDAWGWSDSAARAPATRARATTDTWNWSDSATRVGPLWYENFDALTVGSPPAGWSETGDLGKWTVQNAPAGLTGRVLRSAQDTVTSAFIASPPHTTVTNAIVSHIVKVKTGGSVAANQRWGYFRVNNGLTNVAWYLLFLDSRCLLITDTTQLTISGLTPDTVYDIVAVTNLATGRVKLKFNGTLYDNAGAGYPNVQQSSIDRVQVDSYSPSATGGSYVQMDEMGVFLGDLITNPITAPNPGTAYVSGTHSGVVCGNLHNGAIVGVYDEDPASQLATAIKIERSADGGSTWATLPASTCERINLDGRSWRFIDRRPTYGPQSVAALGGVLKYRISSINLGVTGSPSAVVTITSGGDRIALLDAQAAVHSAAMGGSALTSTTSPSKVYAGQSLLAMAWFYYRSYVRGVPNSAYLTNAQAQFAYIQTLCNADNLLTFPGFTSQIYIDHHGRTIYHIAAAARLLRFAGQSSTAATMIAQADLMAKAIFDKLNNGNPVYNYTFPGYLPGNQASRTNNTVYAAGAIINGGNGRSYRAMNGGTSSSVAPTYPTTTGGTVTDNAGTGHSATPITWREMSANGNTLYRTFSSTPPYNTSDFAGPSSFDINQVSEQAAMLALLCTDQDSAFFNAGTYRTKALDVIQGTSAVVTTYQGSLGKIPIGYDSSFAASYEEYDTLYGGFTIETFAVIYRLLGSQHPAMLLWLQAGLAWLERDYATEPLTSMAWDTGVVNGVSFFQLGTREVAARLLTNAPASTTHLMWEAPFWTINDGMYQAYNVNGVLTADTAPYSLDRWEPWAILDAVIATAQSGDTWNWSDTNTRSLVPGRATSDAWAWSDAAQGARIVTRTTGDTWNWNDTAAASIQRPRTTSDAWGWSDSATGQRSAGRSTSDTWNWSEAATRSLVEPRSTSDTWAWSDSAAATGTRARSTSDTWAWSDGGTGVRVTLRSSSDIWNWSESAVRTLAGPRSTTDTWNWSESATRSAQAFSRSTSDTWNWHDGALIIVPGGSSDTWNWSDSAARVASRNATSTDTWAWSDNTARTTSLRYTTVGDTWNWSESAARQRTMLRLTSDTWHWSDVATGERITLFPRNTSDAWGWHDSGAASVPPFLNRDLGTFRPGDVARGGGRPRSIPNPAGQAKTIES